VRFDGAAEGVTRFVLSLPRPPAPSSNGHHGRNGKTAAEKV
jgi:hypothetical protein